MKKKWYRSNAMKMVLVIAEHILAAFMIISILCVLAYPVFAVELFSGRTSDKYEDSLVFEENMKKQTTKVINGFYLQDLWETDGKYNPDKIIDVEEYWEHGLISGKDTSGLSFHLKDILSWDTDINTYESENDFIIVCEKKDGTYKYYKYAQFLANINEGKFRLNGYLGDGEDLFSYLEQMGNTRENFLQIQNEKGETLFVNCWKYDGTYLTNQHKPVGAESILELVNNNEHWNGRLQDACDMIVSVVNDFREKEYTYWESVNDMKAGDSNYQFVYVDKGTGRVYSNCKEYVDFKQADRYVREITGLGKYVVVEPLLSGFDSNLKEAEAAAWRDTVKYAGDSEADFLFAAAVDTDFPIQDSFYTESQIYEKYGNTVQTFMILGIVSVVFWLAGLIWLTMIAGKNPHNEDVVLNRFDSWKTEIAAALTVVCCVFPALAGIALFADNVWLMSYQQGLSEYSTGYPLVILAATGLILAAFAVFMTGYLSLVRRVKAKTLWKNSLLRKGVGFARFVFDHIQGVWRMLLVFAAFLGVQLFAVLFYYTGNGGYYTGNGGFFIFVMFCVDILAGIYLIFYAIGKEKIKEGIARIAQGEVDYKISTDKMLPEHKRIAETVNEIGAGLDAAVEKSMKSERLKTDLITNVSHDIKTPLTSIINYVDLLKKENFQDEKIRHYIEVLEQKAQRLKVLTEDVVEASKVSSGNVNLEYMRINFVEMIQQTSGEFEEKFKKRGLQEILQLPDEDVIIRVDGRRTWRILENLYNNAAKYAMEGSRVYVGLKVVDDKAVFELKNISEQPLNISADELTERFIRGDISRSTEGSGLGLSIARSLTELQGGRFELYLDGDLFKVTVEFVTV